MTERQVFASLALYARDLAIGRGGLVLADALELDLVNGQCLVLRGPNGAGKSTLLLTLAGIVAPLGGRCGLTAHNNHGDDDTGPQLHYCGHRNALKPRLSVLENLAFWAILNGPTGMAPVQALERVGLGAIMGLDAGYLSAGQGRRLALARLLVSARPLWLLDEPTAALDAQGHTLVTGLIEAHLDGGGMVIAATHDPITLADPARMHTLAIGAAP